MNIDEFLDIYTPVELEKLGGTNFEQRVPKERLVRKLLESVEQRIEGRYTQGIGVKKRVASPSPVRKTPTLKKPDHRIDFSKSDAFKRTFH